MATIRYVWGQYTKEQQYYTATGYQAASFSGTGGTFTYDLVESNNYQFTMGSGYSINQHSGTMSLTGSRTYKGGLGTIGNSFGSGYLKVSGITGGAPNGVNPSDVQIVKGSNWISKNKVLDVGYCIESNNWTGYYPKEYYYQDYYYVKGSFIKNISNVNSNAYPNGTYTGSYWYEKLGSDIIDPDIVTIPDKITKNDIITITVTPSSQKTQPGTVLYNYQYNFGDDQWIDLVSDTSSISYILKIPEGTPTVQIRVLAKDNLGFISSTWIISNKVSVINNIAPTAPRSILVENVYAEQKATISIQSATDEDGYVVKYIYERSIDGSQFEEFFTDTENLLSTTDMIDKNWGTVAYRIKAVDDDGAEGPYITSITYAINEGFLTIATPSYNLGERINPFYFIFAIRTAGSPLSTDVKYKVLLDNKDYISGETNFDENIYVPIDSRLLSAKSHDIIIQATKEGYQMAEESNTFYIPGISAPAGGVIEQLQNSKGQAVLPYTLAQCVIGKDGKDMNALLEEQEASQIKVYSSNYTGTGAFGESSPNTIILTFEPKFVFLLKEGQSTGLIWGGSPTLGNIHFSSSPNSLAWYADSAEEQYNVSGAKYYYTIIG